MAEASNPFAFPIPSHGEPGMSLRDYFAGQALAGMKPINAADGAMIVARAAYKAADAMLAEREKRAVAAA